MNVAASALKRWREHPAAFVEQALGVIPDKWQAEALEAFPHNQRLAMKACKGPGKTGLLSWLAWNFLATRPHPKVIATSITGDNLRDGLWAEMAKWQGVSPFLTQAFQWSAERITNKQHSKTWFMSARTWAQSADPTQQANTLAGIHADYVLFILDEAGGIPKGVMSAAMGALNSGIETRIAIAGNPTHLEGPLYDACVTDRADWYVVEITGDPDNPNRSPRIDIELARKEIAKKGRDNPEVRVNILGLFPLVQSNALLGPDEVGESMQRPLTEREYMEEARILGVDVARFGDDNSVIFPRQGRAAFKPQVVDQADTMQLAYQVQLVIQRWQPDAVFVDVIGIGAGVVDRLRELGHRVIGVASSEKALESQKYINRRIEMWESMAEWVRAGGCLPDDPRLRRELVSPTYKFARDGRKQLESKEDIKKRLGKSPDVADALALTFAMPVAPGGPGRLLRQGHRVMHEYNPYDEVK